MASQVQESSKKTFLDLAAELRNRIYFLCLSSPNGTKIDLCTLCTSPRHGHSLYLLAKCQSQYHKRRIGIDESSTKPPTVAILATCKTIHDEATPILYGIHSFKVYDSYTLKIFSAKVRSSLSLVRNLKIQDYGIYNPGGLATLLASSMPLHTLRLPFPETAGIGSTANMVERLLPLVKQIKAHRRATGGNLAVEKIVRFVPARGSAVPEGRAEEYTNMISSWLKQRLEVDEMDETEEGTNVYSYRGLQVSQ